MDSTHEQSGPRFAQSVVRFCGVIAVVGWSIVVLSWVAARLGAGPLLGPLVALATLALFVLGYLSVLGTVVGLSWAIPSAGRRLGRSGFAWFGVNAAFAVVCVGWTVATCLEFLPPSK